MAKNIAISRYYGFKNFGDEAILKVLTTELKSRNYNITVFSKSPTDTAKQLGVNCVYTFGIKNIIKTLKNVDVLFSGGGSLLQDTTSIKSLFYYLFVIAVALFFKKDVIIFAQGIGPIRSFAGKIFTSLLLKKCKYVTVRDEKSLELLKSWRIKAIAVSDPVWGLDLSNTNSTGTVGIQLRSWKNLSNEYLKKLARHICEHFADKDINIYSFQDSLDLDICRKFEWMLKDFKPELRTKVLSNLSIDEILKSFSELEYLVAMRYHACLLAMKLGIPTVALSYDTKVEKLAQKFSLPCSNLDTNENIDEIIKQIFDINKQEIFEKAKEYKFDFENFVNAIEA